MVFINGAKLKFECFWVTKLNVLRIIVHGNCLRRYNHSYDDLKIIVKWMLLGPA